MLISEHELHLYLGVLAGITRGWGPNIPADAQYQRRTSRVTNPHRG
jgi:hypothetical protein